MLVVEPKYHLTLSNPPFPHLMGRIVLYASCIFIPVMLTDSLIVHANPHNELKECLTVKKFIHASPGDGRKAHRSVILHWLVSHPTSDTEKMILSRSAYECATCAMMKPCVFCCEGGNWF